ncbi:MAG: hypothetical protein CMH60_00325 [Myxococcales bacterium]|nr:hypothetical protein [Myxococcales bacterium]
MNLSEWIEDLINLLIAFYFIIPAIKRFFKRFFSSEKKVPVEHQATSVEPDRAQHVAEVRAQLRHLDGAQEKLFNRLSELEAALLEGEDHGWEAEFRAIGETFKVIDRRFERINRKFSEAQLSHGPLLDIYQALLDDQEHMRDIFRQLLAAEASLSREEPAELPVESPPEPVEVAPKPLSKAPEPSQEAFYIPSSSAYQLAKQVPISRQKVLREAVLLRAILGRRTSYFP